MPNITCHIDGDITFVHNIYLHKNCHWFNAVNKNL